MDMERKRECSDSGFWLTGSVLLLLVLLGSGGVVANRVAAATLPDGRVYEQVSPVDKSGSDIEGMPAMASVDGNRLFFVSRGSFAGQPTALASEASPYLATRGQDRWETVGIGLPNGQLSFGAEGYQGFTESLSRGLISWQEDTRFGPYDPSAQSTAGAVNQYIRDTETGAFHLVNGTLSPLRRDEGFIWGSSDFGVIALESTHPLTADSPCTGSDNCAYESVQGVVRLASVLPNGDPVVGAVGNRWLTSVACNTDHAVSNDGHRIFFTATADGHQLYAREDGVSTSLVSSSERTLPGGTTGTGVNYQSAEAAHGNRVLFTTKDALVDADTNSVNDLYLFDFTKPLGERLTLISQDQDPAAPDGAAVNPGSSGCGGLVGASEDLRRVYFVADNQIVNGAPADPGPKLFLWDDTGITPQVVFVATLDPKDNRDWAAPSADVRNQGIPRQSRWSRDGRYLAFISVAPLVGSDDNEEADVYRFDASTQALDCVSCSDDALPAKGEVTFHPSFAFINPVNHLPRNVSDSGQVFFQTVRGLVAEDSNGQQDVYEYDGNPHLISRGSGDAASSFIDATPDGNDVFFATRDRLVGWDTDDNLDAYDARVGGGLPEPGFTPPACEGEACLSPAVAPNDPAPGSSSFRGAGNVKGQHARRCPAGKVRRHGKCRKRKHSRKHSRPTTTSPTRG